MFERLKSLPLTIILTILIWMYAESQVRLDTNQQETIVKAVEPLHTPPEIIHTDLLPKEVNVLISSRTLQAIGGTSNLKIIAVPQRDLASLPPGVEQTIEVSFIPEHPGSTEEPITITPEKGTVTLITAKKP